MTNMIDNKKTYKLSNSFKIVFSFTVLFLASFLFQSNTHALVQEDDIMKKWVITQYYQCLVSSNINNKLSRENEEGKMKTGDVRTDVMKEEGTLHLPSYNYGHYGSDSIDCHQLFMGGEDLKKGVVDYVGYGSEISWQDVNKTKEFLNKVGYTEQTNSQQYIVLSWSENNESKSIVIVPDGDRYKVSNADTNYYGSTFSLNFGNNSLTVTFSGNSINVVREIEYGANINSFVNNINSSQGLGGFNTTVDYDGGYTMLQRAYSFSSAPASTQNVSNYSFHLNATQAVESLTGSSDINNDFRLNNNERYTLYSNYLVVATRASNGQIVCSEERNEDGWVSVSLKHNNEFAKCYVNFGGNDLANMDRVFTQTYQGNIIIRTISMQEMIDWFNTNVPNNVDLDEVQNINEINNIDNTTTEENNTACLSSDVGFAYIICPLINTITDTAEGIYSTFVEPSLRVEPQLFTGGTSNEVSVVWGTFRDIANTIFVIFLLLIIFSQLTGYGITNYGIKKLLPKLIIAVILINLSYLLCLGCVDLSNIVGNSLKAMFDNLGSGLNAIPKVDGQPLNDASSAGILSIGILGSVGTAAAIFLNPALIITLLVTALGVLISIFFMFILLAARQAAIIVLIVISPVIMVLYVLPNTQRWFDKMLKIWWALILLYPIMGLLMGGGNFAAKLLLDMGYASSGTFQAFAAMVIGIIPIFLAPELVNNAFSGLNNIGAKIAGVGNKIGSTSTGAIKNTSGYKALQQAGAARGNRILAGLDKNGRPTGLNNLLSKVAGSKFGSLGYNRLYKARVESARKDQESQREATTLAGELQKEYADARIEQNDEKYFKERLEEIKNSTDDNAKLAVLAQMDRSNLQASKKAELVRKAFGGKEQDKVFLQKCAQMFGNSFLKKDFEMFDWMRKGGIGADNKAHSLGAAGAWAKDNINNDDMKDEDVAALSSSNLYEMIKAGKITQAQAQRVWASNPNMDDATRLIMGAWGNAGAQLTKTQAQDLLNLKKGEKRTYGGYEYNRDVVGAYTERTPERVHETGTDLPGPRKTGTDTSTPPPSSSSS